MEPINEKEFVRGIFWLGLVIMLIGSGPILIGLNGDSENLQAPRWLVVMIGVMFFNAGVVVALMDSMFNSLRQNIVFATFQGLALLSVPLCLLIAFNWVAFGRGEREFSLSISIPFISGYFENSAEWLGRLMFGIPTALMDLVLGGAILKAVYDGLAAWINEED